MVDDATMPKIFSMTATDPDSKQFDHKQTAIANIPALNLNIFITELVAWSVDGLVLITGAAKSSCISSLSLIEKAKKTIISPMLPRDSIIGRPFTPLGAGGLSAIIGLSGTLLGPNGTLVLPSSQPNFQPLIDNQVAVAGSVLSSDIMIDNSNLQTVIPEGRTREEVVMHKVEGGETLESIAKEYKVTVDSIKYVNDMGGDDTILPGQELTILPVSGVLHTVESGETVESIAKDWEVPAQAIVDINWLDQPYQVHKGQKLVIPNAEIPKPVEESSQPSAAPGYMAAAPQVQSQPVTSSGRFQFPVSGQITQYFSYYHNGIDIGTMNSTPPIWSAESGVVTFAGWWNGGGGYSVWVDHGNGLVTQYAHMSQIHVSVGQAVGRGQQLGNAGNTGLSFGNHLHFTVLQNGQPINPLSVL